MVYFSWDFTVRSPGHLAEMCDDTMGLLCKTYQTNITVETLAREVERADLGHPDKILVPELSDYRNSLVRQSSSLAQNLTAI